jgi:hypothetical protein
MYKGTGLYLIKLLQLFKGGRCVRLTLPPSCAVVMKSGNLNFWNPLGHSRSVTGLLYLFKSSCPEVIIK